MGRIVGRENLTVVGFDEDGEQVEYSLSEAPAHLLVERVEALEDFLSLGIDDYHADEGEALFDELEERLLDGDEGVDEGDVAFAAGVLDDLREEHEAIWG